MKEETLSDKRKELFEHAMHISTTKDEELLVNTIFLYLDKQDKESIKRLKDEFQDGLIYIGSDIKKEIDKIFGNELTK